MRNDMGLQARNGRGGAGSVSNSNGSKFTWRSISSYLKGVSSNAGNIAATVRTAGVSIASSASQSDQEKHREQVQWASFGILDVAPALARHVLLLTYMNGFQVWDVEDASDVRELVSRRDGRVAFLHLQPWPYSVEIGDFKGMQPLLLVATGDLATKRGASMPGGFPGGLNGTATADMGDGSFLPSVVRFYSLQSHAYVHELRFRTGICAVRCSSRIIAVALAAQIYCFDAATLQNTFSVVSFYIPPQAGPVNGYGALALGPRWMAYAANQPLMSSVGRVSPQHLSPSPGISPSTSPATGGFVDYARESSKQLAALGYKTLSKYCSERPSDGVESEYAGTVIVRDYVNKKVIAQFRAHSSPISALCFDPSGTLLVTASDGHNLNVFRLTPTAHDNLTNPHTSSSFVHLYKLCRGLTNAIIQDISFSLDSHWIAVSSSRGTSHLFAISPFGGVVGPHTHGACSSDPFNGPSIMPTPAYPWWSNAGPVRASQQTLPPPPPPLTLSVVSRIKNGFGGWRGNLRSSSGPAGGGAVAAGFHDGGGIHEPGGAVALKDKLWVLSSSGYLVRYLLRPSTASECGYSTEGSSSPSQSHDLRLVVEPSEKWDVCRRLNWAEREERVEHLAGSYTCSDVESSSGGSLSGSIQGKIGKEGMAVDELKRWYMSNAEVQQINQSRPLPIWTKPNVYFHVMLFDSSTKDSMDESEIENIPTRVIEVRRKDLKPLVETLQRVQGSGLRPYETVSGSSKPQAIHFMDESVNDDLRFGEVHIQRSSSGSSFSSEGPIADGAYAQNGYHHNYQDFPEVFPMGASSSFELSPPFQYHLSADSPRPRAPSLKSSEHNNSFRTKIVSGGPSLSPSPVDIISCKMGNDIATQSTKVGEPPEDVEGATKIISVHTKLACSDDDNCACDVGSIEENAAARNVEGGINKEEECRSNDDAWEGALFPFYEED